MAIRLRVTMLATHFPRPTNPAVGVWALKQAQAFRRANIDVQVVSLCDWVPSAVARLVPHRAITSRAHCPREALWEDLKVNYPRWPRYHRGPHARVAYAHPGIEVGFAWAVARRTVVPMVANFRPNLIYAHGTAVNGSVGRDLAQRLRVPLITHDHDHAEIRDCVRFRARSYHMRRIVTFSAANIVVSSTMRDNFTSVFPQGNPVVVPNGADLPPRPARVDMSNRILCVAGFYPRKQIPLLLDAFAGVAAAHPAATLCIVGDGVERALVHQRVRSHGLVDRVTLLGFQPHERVLQEIHNAGVFALLSRDEPFGVVYLEALAAGVPIVCTDQAGVAEYITDRVHGRVVRSGDVASAAQALDELLANASMRQTMGRAGRDLVARQLTWDANANSLSEIFDRCVSIPVITG